MNHAFPPLEGAGGGILLQPKTIINFSRKAIAAFHFNVRPACPIFIGAVRYYLFVVTALY